jgi:hypothetical protein
MSAIHRTASLSQACVYRGAWDRWRAAWWLAAVALCLASLVVARPSQAQASFRGLGAPAYAAGVSADGSVIVGSPVERPSVGRSPEGWSVSAICPGVGPGVLRGESRPTARS